MPVPVLISYKLGDLVNEQGLHDTITCKISCAQAKIAVHFMSAAFWLWFAILDPPAGLHLTQMESHEVWE